MGYYGNRSDENSLLEANIIFIECSRCSFEPVNTANKSPLWCGIGCGYKHVVTGRLKQSWHINATVCSDQLPGVIPAEFCQYVHQNDIHGRSIPAEEYTRRTFIWLLSSGAHLSLHRETGGFQSWANHHWIYNGGTFGTLCRIMMRRLTSCVEHPMIHRSEYVCLKILKAQRTFFLYFTKQQVHYQMVYFHLVSWIINLYLVVILLISHYHAYTNNLSKSVRFIANTDYKYFLENLFLPIIVIFGVFTFSLFFYHPLTLRYEIFKYSYHIYGSVLGPQWNNYF
jgi:hypothetical protein